MSDIEQEPRIGLLLYYGSLMNDYKGYILTLLVASFTVVGIWVAVLSSDLLPLKSYMISIMPIVLGVFVFLIVFCLGRFRWFGKIAESAVRSPLFGLSTNTQVNGPLIGQLDRKIKEDVRNRGLVGLGEVHWQLVIVSGAVAFLAWLLISSLTYWVYGILGLS